MDYKVVAGREVFENGTVKKWRCPKCQWWLNWAEEACTACGALRSSSDDGSIELHG
jgi:rubrerythrin